ncbi:triosephosphate isomerase (TIM) [uncultured bacterium]|nr:triosephosphate isomerase (TIM) [uncultured bacterium]
MRKMIIAGNWKMNTTITETVALISAIKNELKNEAPACEVVVCPPFTSLETAGTVTKDSVIATGAQNMYFEESGAYTGEISATMLKSIGCKYVILGHSERRTIFNEGNALINRKLHKALESGLLPIFCIGETLGERESGVTFKVIETQVREGLTGVSTDQMSKVVIAYEPVWAIGTGKTATPDQAQEVHAFIRGLLKELYGAAVADATVIQYGGSVNAANAKELLGQPDIDGALVGGAALKADQFRTIIRSC